MLKITHTHAEGTIIDGTARGDGSAEVLKVQRWRWGRSIGAWYIPHSRDKLAQSHRIEQTVKALTEAGFEVEVEVQDGHRSTAKVEADLAARRADRAEALEAKAARKANVVDQAWKRSERADAAVPPGGEPVKIGHHSEGRHRRSIERAHTALGAFVEASQDADTAAARAEVAGHSIETRHNPVTVANRIAKFEAEARRRQRKLDGYTKVYFTDSQGKKYGDVFPPATGEYRIRLEAELAELTDQNTYWKGVRAEQVTSGEATDYGPDTISKGDFVRCRGGWCEVLRVNPKSVSVGSHGVRFKITYPGIKEVKKPAAE